MKALILDGSSQHNETLKMVHDIMNEELNTTGWEVMSFILRDIKISPCLGCFSCWIKTPGICVTDDAGRDIVRHATQSNLWIFLTAVTFGGYASELKKAIDRMLPLLLPQFIKIEGHTYHPWRPKIHPIFIVFGMMEQADDDVKKIFNNLVTHSAVNFRTSNYMPEIVLLDETKDAIRIKVKSLLQKMKYLDNEQSKKSFALNR